jgi:hypothetical protein
MNLQRSNSKTRRLKGLIGFSVQVILLVAVIGSSWTIQVENPQSEKTSALTSQSLDASVSQDCIPSTSLADFLFNASLEPFIFSEFSIDLSTQKTHNCVAFSVNGYTRNHFYTFITTKAP